MFKDYKAMFKSLREVQEKLWNDSLAQVPGAMVPTGVDEWQQKTLESFNAWAGQAVSQSLELQRAWLTQWAERANGKDLKPKGFAALNAEAHRSASNWLDNQQRLWNQWAQLLRDSGGATGMPNLGEVENAFRDAMQRQMALLEDWSRMTNMESMKLKEFDKLSEQIVKTMQRSIETHQRLWSLWLGNLPVEPASVAQSAAPAGTSAKKPGPGKVAAPAPTAAPSDDDLKRISGIGPGLEAKLKARGLTSFAQIAALTDADIAELEKTVIRFPGRIKRDNWVEQARALIG
ncbi:hypothetical protein ACKVEX_08760 [Rhodocyclaceae bacterium SMB388]